MPIAKRFVVLTAGWCSLLVAGPSLRAPVVRLTATHHWAGDGTLEDLRDNNPWDGLDVEPVLEFTKPKCIKFRGWGEVKQVLGKRKKRNWHELNVEASLVDEGVKIIRCVPARHRIASTVVLWQAAICRYTGCRHSCWLLC